MEWTQAQRKVIETRNKNLLVSAAAGSGKTAVLVERIISMISEGENPLDIDHLLVVTFTNAAAAQMKNKIGKALDEKLIKEPNNTHLQKQVSLLQSAAITTIHSFCLNVIRNYFHHIDLDPSFKMAEESEITLMKSDIISEVLEKWYEEGREDFHRLIESYSRSKSDQPVEELVLSLYNFAMSNPWPRAWLEKIQESFSYETVEDMSRAEWMIRLLDYVSAVIHDLKKKIEKAIDICNEPDGPEAYLSALLSDLDMLGKLMQEASYEGYARALSGISYARLSSKRQPDVPEIKKDSVKALREEMKKGIKDLNAQFFFQPIEDMYEDLKAVGEVMEVLSELTLDFMEAFAAKKEEKNLIDYNDMEHFALRILADKKDGDIVPTKAAIELSGRFDEILIDEYQDSNLVQETVLKSISREHTGIFNRFMVGDVKQSIYKFRLAMPEIFLDKYKRYGMYDQDEEGNINVNQRIDLDKNFRSRKVVLDFVNTVFEQIMTEPIGGILYDEGASLKYGELYEDDLDNIQGDAEQDCSISSNGASIAGDIRERISRDVELLLVTEEELYEEEGNTYGKEEEDSIESSGKGQEDKPGLYEEEEELQYSKKELEARAVAKRIKELINPDKGLLIQDKDEKGNTIYRPAKLKDIVILLRTMSGWSEVFVNTLMQEQIPAYADTGTGYFQTVEIMTLLNMLRIIDNPRQDIPFAGVLYSPIGGFTSDELAQIRLMDKKATMYTASLIYGEEGGNEDLKRKLKAFLDVLHILRSMVKYTPIHELIQEILDMTGYAYYVMAMPGGDRRKANIDMLVSQAVSFEKGSYSGLFHFIRYIEKLQKYDVDYAEAAVSGEQEDIVRIMSIHKSKGLEFPVVFVSGLSKQFNMQDQRSSILFHADYGVGPDYIDVKNRTKIPTLLKKVIQRTTHIDNMGEELRVLYVAMTRAKEKLIMSGYLKSIEDIDRQKDFSFFELLAAKNYLDWVLPAMNNRFTDYMKIRLLQKKDIIFEEIANQAFMQQDLRDIEAEVAGRKDNEDVRKEIERRLYFQYPYAGESKLRVKLSVSELKKLGQFADEEDGELLYRNTDTGDNQYVPEFIRGIQDKTTGAGRGVLYHKVLELLELSKVNSYSDLTRELDKMVQDRKLTKKDIEKLNLNNVLQFARSNLAQRIINAEAAGKLYKEKQFVIGVKASEIYPEQSGDRLILVQGIIDAFFEEDKELVILDYKSDRIQDESQLADRYKVQLLYYKKALEQIVGKRVKEMIIYSLHLGREIYIK